MRAELIESVRRLALVGLAIGATLFLLTGCAPAHSEPFLRWESRPAAVPLQGHVAIHAVVNMRPAKRGDQDVNTVGNIREGTRVPAPIRVDGESSTFKFEPQKLDAALIGFVKDALGAANIGTTSADDSSAGARVVVEIHELWVDGVGSLADNYIANVSLVLVIQDPVTGQVRATLPVRGEGSETPGLHTHHDVFAKRALHEALDQAYGSLVDGFAQPAARAALTAPPQKARAASAASAARSPAGPCSSELMVVDADGHCCWQGQVWANDRCNGRPAKCPAGQSPRGDRCVGAP